MSIHSDIKVITAPLVLPTAIAGEPVLLFISGKHMLHYWDTPPSYQYRFITRAHISVFFFCLGWTKKTDLVPHPLIQGGFLLSVSLYCDSRDTSQPSNYTDQHCSLLPAAWSSEKIQTGWLTRSRSADRLLFNRRGHTWIQIHTVPAEKAKFWSMYDQLKEMFSFVIGSSV